MEKDWKWLKPLLTICCLFDLAFSLILFVVFSLLKELKGIWYFHCWKQQQKKKQGICIKVLRFRLEQLLSFFTDSRSFLHASCTKIQHAHYIPLRTNGNQLKILWARFKSKSKTTLASTTEKNHSWVLETHTAHLHL